jgi:hypothetical protein
MWIALYHGGWQKLVPPSKFVDPKLEFKFLLIYYIKYTMFLCVFTFWAYSPYSLSSCKSEILYTRVSLIHFIESPKIICGPKAHPKAILELI